MARIRTIKPEFWEDETIGTLSRDARLLFIATLNLADDEGLLRWSPSYIKASAFMYDDDLSTLDGQKLMHEVADAGLVFPYIGGKARQQMAFIVNFRKHQRINRPQPSKLPPPSLQSAEVRRMYARRDGWTCYLCGGQIPQRPVSNDSFNLSVDHVTPQSQGGSDLPTNVRAAHQACNKSKRDQGVDDFVVPRSMAGLNDALSGSLNDARHVADGDPCPEYPAAFSTESDIHSLNHSVNGSLPNSLPEGKGKGREGNREGKGFTSAIAADAPDDDPPDMAEAGAAAKPRATMPAPVRIDVEQACTLLADLVEANGSRRPAIGKRWRDAARLMLDKDGIALEDALGAIRWSQAHEFWRSNVMSMPTLREKYDTLRLQAQRGRTQQFAATGTDGRMSTADMRVAQAAELSARLAAQENE